MQQQNPFVFHASPSPEQGVDPVPVLPTLVELTPEVDEDLPPGTATSVAGIADRPLERVTVNDHDARVVGSTFQVLI